jgi:molybdopterin-containing oxidoreductase family iron-sulfur binding subunit
MYEKISMGDGNQSNNPWLQELPDPLSRACWDNYLTMSAATARELGIANWNVSNGALNGNMVNITVNGKTFNNVPVMIQPGQAVGSVAMAVGYGRTAAGKCGDGIGFNAFALGNGAATIQVVGGEYEFAATQLHHTMMGREIIKETTLADFIKDPHSGNHQVTYATHNGQQPADKVTLWDAHDHSTGHFWNMSIDLTSCIGCSACVVSCHAENNVPVVGKEEVRKSRDMHWLRIDRYFSSDMTKELSAKEKVSAIEMYAEMEEPSANPEVAFQPVMCQHCNHAPCETVCPVAATSHGNEGQNHMAYNRCVGTRYCANNCPYKVRRFNWFQYSDNDKFDFNMNDDYGKMVLNPDVVVRSRGVIEKCSMCIQKIQEIKLDAKKAGTRVKDVDAQTACSSACPTNAIVFGDVNDDSHQIQTLKKNPRAYKLLELLNTDPSVFYQTKIRNKA